MVLPELIPAWFPVEIALISVVSLIVSILLFNKGVKWVVNLLAVDEPLVIATGVTIVAASDPLTESVGGDPMHWVVLGSAVALFGVYAVYSDRVDLDFVG